MDKEFVPHTEAYELKSIGFDEPCFGYYDSEGLRRDEIFWNRENKNSLFVEPEKTNNPKISAPTFSQAFRWFRKNYNLHPAIYPINQHWECDIRHTNKDTNSSIFSWDNEFEYEEAELACLRKLIEIVKNKKNVA